MCALKPEGIDPKPPLSPWRGVDALGSQSFSYQILSDRLGELAGSLNDIFHKTSVKKAVLLEGQPGVGKSTLLEALCQMQGRKKLAIMDIARARSNPTDYYLVLDEWNEGVLETARKTGVPVVLNEINLYYESVDFLRKIYASDTDPSFRLLASQNPYDGSEDTYFESPQIYDLLVKRDYPVLNQAELLKYCELKLGPSCYEKHESYIQENVCSYLSNPLCNEDFRQFLGMCSVMQAECMSRERAEKSRCLGHGVFSRPRSAPVSSEGSTFTSPS